MKKITSLLLAAVSLLGIFALTACGKEAPEEIDTSPKIKEDAAYQLIAEMYKTMDTFESYTITTASNLKFAYNGETFYMEEEITDQVSGFGTDEFVHRREVVSETETGGAKTKSIHYDGYQDGYMYRRFTEDKLERKICSPISCEDYVEYRNENNQNPLIDILYDESLTATASVTEREDGGKSVTLSDFNDAFIERFNRDMNLGVISDIISLKSMTVTFEISADNIYESSTVDFLMDLIGRDIEFTETATVSDLNSTKIKTYSLDSYTRISDLRLVDKVSRSINSTLAADKIEAELTIDANFKSEKYQEKDLIATDRSNGFEYDISSEAASVNSKITYHNGEKRIYIDQNGTMQEVSVTVSQQLAEIVFIQNLLDYGMFDPDYVTAIETEGEKIVITLDPSEQFKAAHPSPISTYSIDTVTITITMDGDNISVYQTDIEYKYRYYNEDVEKGTINAVCKFKR